MTDFKETEEPLKNGQKPDNENETVEIQDDKAVDKDVSGFLDDDLEIDFIPEEETEAFLNEVNFRSEAVEENRSFQKDKREETWPETMQPDVVDSEAAEPDNVDEKMPERGGRSRKKAPALKENVGVVSYSMAAEERIESEPEQAKKEPVKKEKRSKASQKKKAALIAAGAFLGVLLVCGGVYAGIGQKYRSVFFPNTQINGIDVSGKTTAEVEKLIAEGIADYTLKIEERGGQTETLTGKEIMLRPEFDGSLEKKLEEQNSLAWLSHMFNPSSHQIEAMIVYDDGAFKAQISKLECMLPSSMVKPENARISEYVSGSGYSVVPEVEGTTTVPEVVEKGIAEAVSGLKASIVLEELGAYESAAVKSDDAVLNTLCSTMNQYTGVTVTYQFGDKREVLNGDRINEWLIVNPDFTVSVDAEKAAAFVDELAITYDTYNKGKTMKTSYGPTIQVTGGTYGWKINRAAEVEALLGQITTGQGGEREPVYSQKAASHSGNDYGDTYVEINLTAQHLFFYKNGSLVTESDFVSGNLSKGWGTPAGAFSLNYKQRNAILKGEGYRTPVNYWMPFNGGIGMHDANWRSSFGGAIYKTGGSHGCVNLPPNIAKTIFENISASTPVICYNLGGTESSGSSVKPVETAPPTEAPAETQPLPLPEETQAPETQAPPVTQTPPPETTAPAGPGSDPGLLSGDGNGPGIVQ